MNGRTFLLEIDAAFGDNNGHIAIDETLTGVVGQGDGYIGVFDADIEGDAKDADRFCWSVDVQSGGQDIPFGSSFLDGRVKPRHQDRRLCLEGGEAWGSTWGGAEGRGCRSAGCDLVTMVAVPQIVEGDR